MNGVFCFLPVMALVRTRHGDKSLWYLPPEHPRRINCQPSFNFVDVNGDGKTDVVYERADVTEVSRHALDRGELWHRYRLGSRTYGLLVPVLQVRSSFLDSLMAATLAKQTSSTIVRTPVSFRSLLSTGNSFESDTLWGNKDFGIACRAQTRCRPAFGYFDINGDGKSDFVYNRDNSMELQVILSNGGSFNNDSLWGTQGGGIACNGPTNCQPSFAYVDVTGDGPIRLCLLRSIPTLLGYYPVNLQNFSLTSVNEWLVAQV